MNEDFFFFLIYKLIKIFFFVCIVYFQIYIIKKKKYNLKFIKIKLKKDLFFNINLFYSGDIIFNFFYLG
jgi:hypothetical protein